MENVVLRLFKLFLLNLSALCLSLKEDKRPLLYFPKNKTFVFGIVRYLVQIVQSFTVALVSRLPPKKRRPKFFLHFPKKKTIFFSFNYCMELFNCTLCMLHLSTSCMYYKDKLLMWHLSLQKYFKLFYMLNYCFFSSLLLCTC